MRHAIVILLLGCLLSGCYAITGQATHTTEVVRELAQTRVDTISAPEDERVKLAYRFSAKKLEITATPLLACEDREIHTFTQMNVETIELPWHHWLVLAAGAGLTAVGSYLWISGASAVDSGSSLEVGTHAQEMRYDQGRQDVGIGIGLVSVGGVVLSSELIDWILLSGSEEPLPDVEEMANSTKRTCTEKPEVGLKVVVAGGKQQTATLVTDEAGRATVDLTSAPFADLPYAEPFLSLQCAGCKAVAVSLPDDLSADLVVGRGNVAEMDVWLRLNEGSSHASTVREAKARIEQAEAEKQRKEAEEAAAKKKWLADEQAAKCKQALKGATKALDSKAPKNLREYGARGDIEAATPLIEVVMSEECSDHITEAQRTKLTKQLDGKRKTHETAAVKQDEEIKAMAREYAARVLTDRFLEAGIPALAKAGGTKNTILTIYLPGANDVVVFQLKKGGFFVDAAGAGFKKVIIKACNHAECEYKDHLYWTIEF